jgi:glucose/arabinose dehydrogenase
MRNSQRLVESFAFLTIVIAASPIHGEAIGLQRLAYGLNRPIHVAHAPGDQERLFIVEKPGTIKILNLQTGVINATPFLTVPDTDFSGSEEGLLGLAFHPDYADNGKFYVNVTVDDDGGTVATRTHIREYSVSGNPDIADPVATEVLTINQPQENHNGGWIGFGPNDDYLYTMTGDGGGSHDDDSGHTLGTGNAQDTTDNLLGKVLRIDVDGTNGSTGNYGNPENNPFVGKTGDDEIWAYGLRNPWRASFDRKTGDLWIGDVGQGAREEIDFQPASSSGGENYGWRLREGTIATPTGSVGGPAPSGAIEPVYDYQHGVEALQGYVVTGGHVYRGPDPEIQGQYFFTDSGSNYFWRFNPADPYGTVEDITSAILPDVGTANNIVSFAEDPVGNLYFVRIGNNVNNTTTGAIYRMITNAVVPGDFDADGDVDSDDLPDWQSGYGANADGDADADGDTDGSDFLIWQRNYGTKSTDFEPPSGSDIAVPEPLSGELIVLAVIGSWWLKRR